MTKHDRSTRTIILSFLCWALVACSGNDNNNDLLPLIDAGKDKQVTNYQPAIPLEGSTTLEAGQIQSISWVQTAGPENVEISVKNNIDFIDKVEFTIAKKPSVFAKLQGIWRDEGYGAYLHITEENVALFNQNTVDCLYLRSLPLDEFIQNIDNIAVSDGNQFDQAGRRYVRISALNDSCASKNTAGYNDSPELNFDYVWTQIYDLHAHLDRRAVDWEAIYTQYSPLVTPDMSAEQLLQLISAMLSNIGDFHVALFLEDDTLVQPARKHSKLYKHVKEHIQAPGIEVLPSEDLIHFIGRAPDIEAAYLAAMDNYVEGGHIEYFYNSNTDYPVFGWGKTPDNIGLLVINEMEFDSLETLHSQMNQALLTLQDTKALIIDIRRNAGGTDTIALEIASYFTTEETVAYKKFARNRHGESPIKTVTVKPSNNTPYQKPTYLLTSQDTASAAEIFTMVMDQLPHVLLVGEETQGALSDVLALPLPIGAVLGLSNEIYQNASSEELEAKGIAPDVLVDAFSADAMLSGKVLSYEKALQLIRQ